jgi:integrase
MRTSTAAYSAALTASSPPLHLRPQPEHRTSAAEVDNRAGHVLIGAGESVDEVAFALGHRDATVTRVVYIREISDARRRHMRRSRMITEHAGALRIALADDGT